MKKITICFIAAFLTLTSIPATLRADAAGANTMMANHAREQAEAKVLLNRLSEIKEMTKTTLTSSQKKELRKEVRSIREQLKNKAEGIYLSVGAIIIILLILILIL